MIDAAASPSPRPFDLTIEPPVTVAKKHELQLLRAAVARNPQSVPLRRNLANVLLPLDQFDEVIAILEPLVEQAADFVTLNMLAEAYISRETPEDDVAAGETAVRAQQLARSPYEQAKAMAAGAKALSRQGRKGEARRLLVAALEVDPTNVNAYKRLAALDLEAGDAAGLLRASDRLLDQGVAHARLIVARALALGTLGRIDEARATIGLDDFLHQEIVTPPSGWSDLAAFNLALKHEIMAHPDLRYDRYGTASSNSWRVDTPARAVAPAVLALQQHISAVVRDYVARVDVIDAPWVRARPPAAELHNWCVMTDADGFETWHVHQNGWLSGVYYVDVPPAVADGRGIEGCIAFGLPENLVGKDMAALYGERLVRPLPGMMMLFPSHTYHRTFAHGSDHRRICLAFDIQPR